MAAPTVTVTGVLVTPESAPVIFAVPCESVVTRPAETVATFGADEVHVTDAVRSWLVPSLYSPVAVSWSVRPNATEGELKVIWIEVNEGGGGVLLPELLLQAGSTTRHRSPIRTWNFFINFFL